MTDETRLSVGLVIPRKVRLTCGIFYMYPSLRILEDHLSWFESVFLYRDRESNLKEALCVVRASCLQKLLKEAVRRRCEAAMPCYFRDFRSSSSGTCHLPKAQRHCVQHFWLKSAKCRAVWLHLISGSKSVKYHKRFGVLVVPEAGMNWTSLN